MERLVPMMRLKGFDEEWKSTLLKRLVDFSKGHGYSKNDLNTQGIGDPIILYGRLYTDYEVEISNVNTFVNPRPNSIYSRGDEVIVPGSGETAEDISIASAVIKEGIIIGGDLNILTPKNNDVSPTFLALSISNGKVHKLLSTKAQGKTIVHLHNRDFEDVSVSYPSISEQRAIANYFRHLDKLIDTADKKLNSLIQVKEASLQSMFPKDGCTLPQVRFKGFEGEWEISLLKDISNKVLDKNISLEYKVTLTNSAELGIINQMDYFDYSISKGDNIRNYYIVRNHDFVYNPRISTFAPVGPINQNLLGYDGVMSPLYYVFRIHDIDEAYLRYYFKTKLWHKFMKDNGNSGARFDRLSITDDMFVQMPILHPKEEKEQQKIASFFLNLDKAIDNQKQRLELLKCIKSTCLSEMFV